MFSTLNTFRKNNSLMSDRDVLSFLRFRENDFIPQIQIQNYIPSQIIIVQIDKGIKK